MGIADRGGQQQQPGLGWTENNSFLPDDPALRIGEILRLVHNHQAQRIQSHVDFATGRIVEQVSENLGRHDQKRGVGVVPPVAGQDAHAIRAE